MSTEEVWKLGHLGILGQQFSTGVEKGHTSCMVVNNASFVHNVQDKPVKNINQSLRKL